MTDSAPREAAQADAKQTDAKQPEAAEASASAGEAEAGEAETQHTETQHTDTPDADGKPDMDEVKRKFREALDKKREIQAEGSAGGGRNTGKIHGAHGPEDHRRTFRRKSG